MNGGQGRWTLVAFLVGAVISSGNPIAVKFSNAEIDPFWGATIRYTLAAALMLVILVRRLGGYTGDGLGAVQQLAEIAALTVLAGCWR